MIKFIKRDFYRVIEPLKKFGVNIESKSGKVPVKIIGNNDLRPIISQNIKEVLRSKVLL